MFGARLQGESRLIALFHSALKATKRKIGFGGRGMVGSRGVTIPLFIDPITDPQSLKG